MKEKFTKQALNALSLAEKAARTYGHSYIGTEHMLLGLMREKEGTAGLILEEFAAEEDRLCKMIDKFVAPIDMGASKKEKPEYSPRARKIMEEAVQECEEKAGTEHLLLVMLKETDCVATRLLHTMGINVQKLYSAVLSAMGKEGESFSEELQAEKARLQEQHKSEIGKLRNGYQKEIDKAIHQAEAAERQFKEKDAIIDRQRKQISLLDRKANPQRYSLSSGAELVRVNVSNYRNPSLHIWTRVGDELFDNIKFQIDYDVAQRHFNGQITDEEFVNAVFDPQEQVNGKQTELLGTAFTLAAGGPAEVHIGTGSGGSSSDLPWGEQKNKHRR